MKRGASGPTCEELEDVLQEHVGGCTKGGGGSHPTTEGLKDELSRHEAGSVHCGANGGDGGPMSDLKDDLKKHELRVGGESSSGELNVDVNEEDGGSFMEQLAKDAVKLGCHDGGGGLTDELGEDSQAKNHDKSNHKDVCWTVV